MNAHIWELDGCENENGRRMKENMNEIGLQILNCVWDGLNEATWYTEEKKFTLDYVCMDGRGLKKVVGASILDLGEVIESDHAAIRVEIEWKGVMGQQKKKKKAQKKRCLNKQKWEVFGRRMNGKEFENMSEMNSMLAKEGCEMEKEENWLEDGCLMMLELALMEVENKKYTSIKILNGSGITVNYEQEVVKEVERLWSNLFCTNGKVTLGQKKMIGEGMTSEWQIFSQQEMSVAIKKMK